LVKPKAGAGAKHELLFNKMAWDASVTLQTWLLYLGFAYLGEM
jgi:hypothetical protein